MRLPQKALGKKGSQSLKWAEKLLLGIKQMRKASDHYSDRITHYSFLIFQSFFRHLKKSISQIMI